MVYCVVYNKYSIVFQDRVYQSYDEFLELEWLEFPPAGWTISRANSDYQVQRVAIHLSLLSVQLHGNSIVRMS